MGVGYSPNLQDDDFMRAVTDLYTSHVIGKKHNSVSLRVRPD